MPIDLNLEMSFKSEIPLINEATIKGTAINFNILTKMFPIGSIQFFAKTGPFSNCKRTNPVKIPNVENILTKLRKSARNTMIKALYFHHVFMRVFGWVKRLIN